MDSGEIDITYNCRPMKALKYMGEKDSMTKALRVPILVYCPGENRRRIRREGQEFLPVTGELLAEARDRAFSSLPELVKAAENELENILSDGRLDCLVSYDESGIVGTEDVKEEQWEYITYCGNNTIKLKDRPGGRPSVCRLDILPGRQTAGSQVMFGVL